MQKNAFLFVVLFLLTFRIQALWNDENASWPFSRLLHLLGDTETGKKILRTAKTRLKSEGQTWEDLLSLGEYSSTRTSFRRIFYQENMGVHQLKVKAHIVINRHLNWKEALLDLAHELTHYAFKENFDPYRDLGTVEEFVHMVLEGRGGEVEAFLSECRVAAELFSRESEKELHRIHLCSDIDNPEKIVQKFYQVGNDYQAILQKCSNVRDLKMLTSAEVEFVSAEYDASYPLAAIKEYEALKEKIQMNEKKRQFLGF